MFSSNHYKVSIRVGSATRQPQTQTSSHGSGRIGTNVNHNHNWHALAFVLLVENGKALPVLKLNQVSERVSQSDRMWKQIYGVVGGRVELEVPSGLHMRHMKHIARRLDVCRRLDRLGPKHGRHSFLQ